MKVRWVDGLAHDMTYNKVSNGTNRPSVGYMNTIVHHECFRVMNLFDNEAQSCRHVARKGPGNVSCEIPPK